LSFIHHINSIILDVLEEEWMLIMLASLSKSYKSLYNQY